MFSKVLMAQGNQVSIMSTCRIQPEYSLWLQLDIQLHRQIEVTCGIMFSKILMAQRNKVSIMSTYRIQPEYSLGSSQIDSYTDGQIVVTCGIMFSKVLMAQRNKVSIMSTCRIQPEYSLWLQLDRQLHRQIDRGYLWYHVQQGTYGTEKSGQHHEHVQDPARIQPWLQNPLPWPQQVSPNPIKSPGYKDI